MGLVTSAAIVYSDNIVPMRASLALSSLAKYSGNMGNSM
jgi:hypothetical protein